MMMCSVIRSVGPNIGIILRLSRVVSQSRYAASTLDSWHLAQKFSSRPLLNNAFINEDPPIARVSAVNTSLTNQFIFDSFLNIKMARPMPMYSVPGSIDHFYGVVMGFLSSIADFLAKPIVGTIGSIVTGKQIGRAHV